MLNRTSQAILLTALIVAGMAGVFGLGAVLENRRAHLVPVVEDEDLYLSSQRLKTISGDFRGLVADWYWINSLQYMGRKIVNSHSEHTNLGDLEKLDPRMLYPMLDRTTTLDPHYMAAYAFGAVILPEINEDHAIKFLEKGIADNPAEWRLYQHLGYIYWQKKDYAKAAEVYDEGAAIAGSPPFMKQMSGKVRLEGGSRETARAIYREIHDSAEDSQTKELVYMRLLQLDSLDERDAIKTVLDRFNAKNGRCASSWNEIINDLSKIVLPNGKTLRADRSNVPVDPTDAPYLLKNTGGLCEVDIDRTISKIPPG